MTHYEPPYPGWENRCSHEHGCAGLPSLCECPGATDLWITCATPPQSGLTNTAGKWCIFVNRKDADDLWLALVAATEADELGFATKASFKDRGGNVAIMLYTYDAEDKGDTARVRERLQALLAENNLTLNMFYKTDEATRLGEYSRRDPLGRGPRDGQVLSTPVTAEAVIVTRCQFYNTRKGCRNGSACRYVHDDTPSDRGAANGRGNGGDRPGNGGGRLAREGNDSDFHGGYGTNGGDDDGDGY